MALYRPRASRRRRRLPVPSSRSRVVPASWAWRTADSASRKRFSAAASAGGQPIRVVGRRLEAQPIGIELVAAGHRIAAGRAAELAVVVEPQPRPLPPVFVDRPLAVDLGDPPFGFAQRRAARRQRRARAVALEAEELLGADLAGDEAADDLDIELRFLGRRGFGPGALEIGLGAARRHLEGAAGQALGEQAAGLGVAIEAGEPEAIVDRIGGGGALELGCRSRRSSLSPSASRKTRRATVPPRSTMRTPPSTSCAHWPRSTRLGGAAAVAQAKDAVGEQRDGEAAALVGARRLARPADGMAAHRAAAGRQGGLAAPTAQFVVGIAEGEARARRLTRQLDFRLARHADRREVAVLGKDGGKIGAAGAGIHHLRAGRLGLGGGFGRRRRVD